MQDRPESIDAALHEDDVRVVRHRIERDYGTTELPGDAFQEMEIEIPLRGEEIEIRKRPVVREEVVISKVLRERVFPVSERLRRERVHVEGEYLGDELRDVRLEQSRSGRTS
jgi:stress response protein YsnF